MRDIVIRVFYQRGTRSVMPDCAARACRVRRYSVRPYSVRSVMQRPVMLCPVNAILGGCYIPPG